MYKRTRSAPGRNSNLANQKQNSAFPIAPIQDKNLDVVTFWRRDPYSPTAKVTTEKGTIEITLKM
ncbi:MAG: hypothetical protein NTU49_06415 [Gammaproteobacteria bacterium]|nr:hypothetical protein [Gammaproteobacteria bacterium]